MRVTSQKMFGTISQCRFSRSEKCRCQLDSYVDSWD